MQNDFFGLDAKSLILCFTTYGLNFIAIHLNDVAMTMTVFAGFSTATYNLFKMWLEYKKSKKG